MAVTKINLSDTLIGLVNKNNTISADLGDVAQLVTGDNNVVDAINTIRDLVKRFDDSDEIIAIGRNNLSLTQTIGIGGLEYDSTNGSFIYTAPTDADVRALFQSSADIEYSEQNGKFSLIDKSLTERVVADNSVISSKFKSGVTLQIVASDGSTILKTLHSPGE